MGLQKRWPAGGLSSTTVWRSDLKTIDSSDIEKALAYQPDELIVCKHNQMLVEDYLNARGINIPVGVGDSIAHCEILVVSPAIKSEKEAEEAANAVLLADDSPFKDSLPESISDDETIAVNEAADDAQAPADDNIVLVQKSEVRNLVSSGKSVREVIDFFAAKGLLVTGNQVRGFTMRHTAKGDTFKAKRLYSVT